ncbi:MAG TPA: DUF433 domain-containing protein [Candidatus Omnitrophota bacterium]|nr:DUF433 domain-containing protein [Candidatus Omnitrophota bacterium]
MKQKLLSRSRDVLGGTLVFAGTRVPVQSLIDYFEEGKTLRDFLDDFPTVRKTQAVIVLEKLKLMLAREKHAIVA